MQGRQRRPPRSIDALARLDRDPAVDVIVVARGGGSVEDLLPFSDEALVRAVAACRTPVVSAIGHEQDTPLLDLVADVRASTPTDAAKRVVPDVARGDGRVVQARARLRRAVADLVERELAGLELDAGRAPSCGDPVAGLVNRAPPRSPPCSAAPESPWRTGSTAPPTNWRTPGPGSARCPRPPRWSAATRWSSSRTGACCATRPTRRSTPCCAYASLWASCQPVASRR